jgi:hypothetical protein
MSAKPKPWYHGLTCHLCGRRVNVSGPEGASFHRPALGPPWAEHHVCPPCPAPGTKTLQIADGTPAARR